jgi:hypothetical protein
VPSIVALAVIGPTGPATLAILGIGAGLVLLYRGMGGYRRANLISDIAGSTISAIAVGENRVSGTIEAAELTLTSPLQSEPCVYYRASVTEEGDRSESRIFHDERAVGFRVRDASGAIRVFPRGAAFDVPDVFHARSGMLGDEPIGLRLRNGPATDVAEKDRATQIADLLTVHTPGSALDGSDGSPARRSSAGLFDASGLGLGGGRRQYREARLAVGDPVTVVGMVLPFDQLSDPDGSDAMDGDLGEVTGDPEIAADLAAAEARGALATSPEQAWGNAAIPGFGIGRPVRAPTLDPAASSERLATAAEAARAQRTFDITPASLILAGGSEMRLLVTLGTPAVAAQRADDRFIAGLLGAVLAIGSAVALAWLVSGGLGA